MKSKIIEQIEKLSVLEIRARGGEFFDISVRSAREAVLTPGSLVSKVRARSMDALRRKIA